MRRWTWPVCIQTQVEAAMWDLAPGRQMPPGPGFCLSPLHRGEREEKEFRAPGGKFLQ